MPKYVTTESIFGTWFYHWSKVGNESTALCGKKTMQCSLPTKSWGIVTHLRERYCSRCEAARKESK